MFDRLPARFPVGRLDEQGRLHTPWRRLDLVLNPTERQLRDVSFVRVSVRHDRPDVALPQDWRLTATWTPEQGTKPLELAIKDDRFRPVSLLFEKSTQVPVHGGRFLVHRVTTVAQLELAQGAPLPTELVFGLHGAPDFPDTWPIKIVLAPTNPPRPLDQQLPVLAGLLASQEPGPEAKSRTGVLPKYWARRFVEVQRRDRHAAVIEISRHLDVPLPHRPTSLNDRLYHPVAADIHYAAWAQAAPAHGSAYAWNRMARVARLVLGRDLDAPVDATLLAVTLGLRAGLAPHVADGERARLGCKGRHWGDCGDDEDAATGFLVAAGELEQLTDAKPAGTVDQLQKLLRAYQVGVLEVVRGPHGQRELHAMSVLVRRGHVAQSLARFYGKAEYERLEEDLKPHFAGLDEVDASQPPLVLMDVSEPRLPTLDDRDPRTHALPSPSAELLEANDSFVTFQPWSWHSLGEHWTALRLFLPELTLACGVTYLHLANKAKHVGLTRAELFTEDCVGLAIENSERNAGRLIFERLCDFIPPEPLACLAQETPTADYPTKPAAGGIVFAHPCALTFERDLNNIQPGDRAYEFILEWNQFAVLGLSNPHN